MAEMTAQEAAEWGKTLDFPTVWAAIMRTESQIDKISERMDIRDAQTKENFNKVNERMDIRDAQTKENLDRLGERIDRTAATIKDLGEKIDRVTAETSENIDKVNERMDIRNAQTKENLDKVNERMDIRDAQTKENLDRLGERVDRTAATIKDLGEKVDRVTGNVGGLNRSMGELIETLFASNLWEKFDRYEYNLKRMYPRVPIYDEQSNLRSDIDILLSNTTVCMAVEIKRWLDDDKQVDKHVKRMHLIRQYPPAEVKDKRLLGAMVGAVVTPETREYAKQNGFFVLELTGENVRLLEPPKDFQPKEW